MAAGVLVLGTEPLTLEEVLDIADGRRVRLGAAARARMTVARSVLLAAIEHGQPVYGATRRLGAGAGDDVDDQAAFQVRTIRNHAGALGDPLEADEVRASIAARLGHLALGGSGARPRVAEALAALLDAGIVPVVRDHGSVGMADLALNAAVAQVLIGEGAAVTRAGDLMGGEEALAAAGLEPLALETGEALALLSTNAFSLGVGAVAVARAESLSAIADRVAALSLEAAAAHRPSGDLGPFSESAQAGYEPSGQWRSASMIRLRLSGSFLQDPDRERRVQDELSFRCVPQVHGAFADAVEALALEIDEALAVSPENPLVDVETRGVVANGNFADPGFVLAVESTRLGLAYVTTLAERRIAVLSALARPLRAAGRAGIPGLLAYTAADLASSMRRSAGAASLDPVVLSEVEDAATWAWPAVRSFRDLQVDAVRILAIEALHAGSLLRDAPERARLGDGTRPLAEGVIDLFERTDDAEAMVLGTEALLTEA